MALLWWRWQAPPPREGLPPPSCCHALLCGVRHMPQELGEAACTARSALWSLLLAPQVRVCRYAPTWPSAAPPKCHTSQAKTACLPQTAGHACLDAGQLYERRRLHSVCSSVLRWNLVGKAAQLLPIQPEHCVLTFFQGVRKSASCPTRRQFACQCIGGPASESTLPACPCSACCLGGSLT